MIRQIVPGNEIHLIKKILTALTVLISCFLLVHTVYADSKAAADVGGTVAEIEQLNILPREHTVFAGATSFDPKVLFINPGDTVKWVNMTAHDSVSMEGLVPEGAEHWKFAIGENGSVTLNNQGVYIYKCNPHYAMGMSAAIIVGEPVNMQQVKANASGRAKGVVLKVERAVGQRTIGQR